MLMQFASFDAWGRSCPPGLCGEVRRLALELGVQLLAGEGLRLHRRLRVQARVRAAEARERVPKPEERVRTCRGQS